MIFTKKKKWSINGAIERESSVFYTIRKEFKKQLIQKISEELNCILLVGPRASGKTSTIQDLENDFEDTLFF